MKLKLNGAEIIINWDQQTISIKGGRSPIKGAVQNEERTTGPNEQNQETEKEGSDQGRLSGQRLQERDFEEVIQVFRNWFRLRYPERNVDPTPFDEFIRDVKVGSQFGVPIPSPGDPNE